MSQLMMLGCEKKRSKTVFFWSPLDLRTSYITIARFLRVYFWLFIFNCYPNGTHHHLLEGQKPLAKSVTSRINYVCFFWHGARWRCPFIEFAEKPWKILLLVSDASSRKRRGTAEGSTRPVLLHEDLGEADGRILDGLNHRTNFRVQ